MERKWNVRKNGETKRVWKMKRNWDSRRELEVGKKLNMRKIWKIIAAFVVPTGVAALARAAYELTHFKIERYHIANAKIPEAFSGVKILFLSDLHNTEYGEKNERLLEAIQKEAPDYILIGGDMLVGKPDTSFLPAASLIKKLAKEYPIYCANGNHEYRLKIYPEKYGENTYKDYVNLLKKAGVHYLCNESIKIQRENEKITLTGVEIDAMYYERIKKVNMSEFYLPSILGRRKRKEREEEFCILLAHNPVYFPQYAKWGADLVLSGHVHGGIVRVPFLGGVISPSLTLFPKYDAGRFKEGENEMILSPGLGVHSIPFRLLNMPKMQVITLEHSSGKTSE